MQFCAAKRTFLLAKLAGTLQGSHFEQLKQGVAPATGVRQNGVPSSQGSCCM